MKKTLTINLSGLVYHIDEDAYSLLKDYLTNLRIHFSNEEGVEEIISDMEIRISELFNECLHEGKEVVTIEDVEKVIEQMGRPEEFETYAANEAGNEKEQRKNYTQTKRLYRDPDNKMLGGVAAGIAAYFDWDPTLVRIAFIILGISCPWFLFIYLVAYVVIPEAGNAAEKLSMRGMKVSIENIGKMVTDGMDQVNDYIKSKKPHDFDVRSEKSYNFFHNMAELIVNVVTFLIKIVLVSACIFCLPMLFIFFIICTSLFIAGIGLPWAIPDIMIEALPKGFVYVLSDSPFSSTMMAISGIFSVGIPIMALIHFLMSTFSNWQPMSLNTRIVLFIVWLFSIGSSIFFFFNFMYPYM